MLYIPCSFLFLFFSSYSISLSPILSPFRFHSGFLPFPFLPLSHFATSIPHMFSWLSFLVAHSAPSFLSFHPIPLSILVLLFPRFLSRFMYFHTSFPVLISFISFLLFLPSLLLHFSTFLLVSFFASRRLFLLVLILFHFLSAFTTSFVNCSHSLSHHAFFFLLPFAPLTISSYFVVTFSITSFSSTAIFSTSCCSNLPLYSLLQYSSIPYFYYSLLLLLFFSLLHDSFLLYLFLFLSPLLNSSTFPHVSSFTIP
jgi:hypothetical protein